jgi:hypothetical protein
VEAGYNISTLALSAVEGDEKRTRYLGLQLSHSLTVGRKYRDLVLQVGGWTQGSRTIFCKKIVAKSGEVKTGCNLAESCNEGYGSKRADLPMTIMMMIVMMVNYCQFFQYEQSNFSNTSQPAVDTQRTQPIPI